MSMCSYTLLRSEVRNFCHRDNGLHELVESETGQTRHLNAGNIASELF